MTRVYSRSTICAYWLRIVTLSVGLDVYRVNLHYTATELFSNPSFPGVHIRGLIMLVRIIWVCWYKLLFTLPMHRGMTRLSWPRWLVKYWLDLSAHRPIQVLTRRLNVAMVRANQILSVCPSVSLSVSPYVSLSVYVCVCVCVSLSMAHAYQVLSVCLSVCLSFCLSDCLSVWLSDCLTVSVCLCLCLYRSLAVAHANQVLAVCLSVSLSVCMSLSVCLSL